MVFSAQWLLFPETPIMANINKNLHKELSFFADSHLFKVATIMGGLKVTQILVQDVMAHPSHLHVWTHIPELLKLPEEMSKEWQERAPWQLGMYCGLLLHYALPASTHLGSFYTLHTWFEGAHLLMGILGLQEHVWPSLREYVFDPLSNLIPISKDFNQ